MHLFKEGTIHVLVCTDAAGMVRATVTRQIDAHTLTFNRDATYLISILLYSGRHLKTYHHGSSVLVERPED